MAHEFESIFHANIITISFGENLQEQTFDFNYLVDAKACLFERRQVNIGQALSNIFQDQFKCMLYKRYNNPVSLLGVKCFGINLDLHPVIYTIKENCRLIRARVLDYVTKRKTG